MKYRKLRIVWSVVWGVAAVLLVVLWVRSLQLSDNFQCYVTPTQRLSVRSYWGWLGMSCAWQDPQELVTQSDPIAEYYSVVPKDPDRLAALRTWVLRFDGFDDLAVFHVSFPHWLAVLSAVCFGALPWLPIWRFSLRTLLIATTLVAVGLGIFVWLA